MGIISFIGGIMQWILSFLSQLTGNYGVAIILLTLVIRLSLYPLTVKQARSMVVMKEMQPQLKRLQEKYKENPQEYQKRMMELYREKNINPLSGCLPLLVQLPFLWALFQVLREFPADFPVSPHFLGLDLSVPDPFYILPILSAVTTYFQMTQSMTDPSQRAMGMVMPVVIGWISITFPAGLVLYWVVSNLFSIGQQHVIMKEQTKRQGGPQPT